MNQDSDTIAQIDP
uniref:Uncharacterized protein n=1 Tax=Arundo donax TaxID=35708 RepID=A0A0A9BM90_ARUDO